ncbi:DNA-directed RNA polymerase subunit H [Candidatus Bathyarchaeota archaeon]|nr:DNA-directed RNA polymerase subunit H [Candidatus Bathyarchaeota archaeon]
MSSKNIENGIIVSEKYTQSAKSLARKNNIELIPQDFPSFNIFKHYLVPKHEVLSPEERKVVLEKYRIEPYKLPRIKTSDPIIRVIGAKPGDIVKITRRSPTAGESVYYRYVVEG